MAEPLAAGSRKDSIVKITSAVALASLALIVCACGSEDADGGELQPQTLQGEAGVLTFTATPAQALSQGINTFKLQIVDAGSQEPMAGLGCTVVVSMPTMGMFEDGATVEDLAGGNYQANNVNFSMGGAWELRYECAMEGMSDVVAFTYQVP